jgi:hypothetical protein
MTSAITAASKALSSQGSAIASPMSKRTVPSVGCARA